MSNVWKIFVSSSYFVHFFDCFRQEGNSVRDSPCFSEVEVFSCFVAQQNVGSSSTFPVPALDLSYSPRSPVLFGEECYLEVRIWAVGVFITSGEPLLMCLPMIELGDIQHM